MDGGLVTPPWAVPGRRGAASGWCWWLSPANVGLQLDRGLYGAFLVDAPGEAAIYDAEAVLILDDWLDGTGRTPNDVLRDLGANGMGGMGSGGCQAWARWVLAGPFRVSSAGTQVT